MAAELRGGIRPARLWHDPERRGGAAAMVPGILPEDVFDTQPLVTQDVVFVARVRLDNRADIAAKLGLPQEQAVAIADASLLRLAYDRWGGECLREISGDYAFVAWHPREERLMAAVDPMGYARLLWARADGTLILAGQMTALLAHPRISRAPDLAALARLFDMGVDRASTPYEHVRALPGGHRLDWQDGQATVRRWWQPASRPTERYRNPEDYVERARECFNRAVAAQLRSTGEISSTLSGGLDSGLVTTTAAQALRHSNRGLTAYTSVPAAGLPRADRPGWDSDDGPFASAVVAMHDNVRHVLVPPGRRCTLDLLEDFHTRAGTPSKSVTNFLWFDAISTSIAAQGSRVLLVGLTGNATVSWRGTGSVEELAKEGRWPLAAAQARALASANGRRFWRVLASELRLKDRLRRVTGRWRPIGGPGVGLLRSDRRPPAEGRAGFFALQPGTRSHWVAFATTARHGWWPDPLSQWGVEWRDPTADRWLIECLLSFPLYAFRTEGRDRGLARAMGRGLLPDRVRLRRTSGAQVPELPSVIALHAARYRQALDLMSGSPSCRELFDLHASRAALDQLVRGGLDGTLAVSLDRACDVGLFLCRLEGAC